MGSRRRLVLVNLVAACLVWLHLLHSRQAERELAARCAAHRARLEEAMRPLTLPAGADSPFAAGYAALGYRRIWPRDPGPLPEVGRHLSRVEGRIRCRHHTP